MSSQSDAERLGEALGIYSELNKSFATLNQGLPPGSITPGQPLTASQIAALRRRKWAEKATQRKQEVMRDWVPHPLTKQEYKDELVKTNQCINDIKRLEALLRQNIRERILAEDKLMEARIEYQIHFWRSFRINELPEEILANIFQFVTWSTLGKHAGIVARLWITWTCSHWRRVALENSTLWNVIWMREPPPFSRALAWLDRSGSALMDIRLDDYDKSPLTGQQVGEFFDRAMCKASTIRSLLISLNNWEPALVVLNKLREAANAGATFNVERLELHRNGIPYVQISDGFEPRELRDPIALFGGKESGVPLHLSIIGVHIDWNASALRNLTCLDMRRIPLDRCPSLACFRQVLMDSPSLKQLCLDGAGPHHNPAEAQGLPPVFLKDLRIVMLADFHPEYACYVIELFSGPRVRSLTLMNLGGVNMNYLPLFRLLKSRFPTVHILTLFSVKVNQSVEMIDALIDFFVSMPRLRYLRMSNSSSLLMEILCWDGETKNHFLPPPGRATCPELDILEFHFLGLPERFPEWFSLIKGYQGYRSKINAPLKRLWIPDTHFAKLNPTQRQNLNEVVPLHIFHHQTNSADEMRILREE